MGLGKDRTRPAGQGPRDKKETPPSHLFPYGNLQGFRRGITALSGAADPTFAVMLRSKRQGESLIHRLGYPQAKKASQGPLCCNRHGP